MLHKGDLMFKQATFAVMTIFLGMLSSCNRNATGGFANLDCGSAVEMTFEDWRSWTRVNPTRLLSEGHSSSYVDVYVDDLAKDIYLAAGAPYPEC